MTARVADREALSAGVIRAALDAPQAARIRQLEVLSRIDSTNAELLRREAPPAGWADVLLAEAQTAGRGRRGRSWLAPDGGALLLSLAWSFVRTPDSLSVLGPLVGVCCLRALRRAGIEGVGLKWPNDLVLQGGKLGGILIELRPGSDPAAVVVGIGLNVELDGEHREQIAAAGNTAADLKQAGVAGPARTRLAALLVGEIVAGIESLASAALGPVFAAWREADVLAGRRVRVQEPTATFSGIARGIDSQGALLIETPRGLERVLSGDVSVRAE